MKMWKLTRLNQLKTLNEGQENVVVEMKISEDQLRNLSAMINEYTEIVWMLEQRLRGVSTLVGESDLSPKFDVSCSLIESTHKLIKDVERRLAGYKFQNYEYFY